MKGTIGDNVEPRVSVVMAVYNGERYLREAVDSILGQTFQDFEFIIVEDGSADATPAILDGYTDPRLVRLRNQGNLGLTRSLNRGLATARGEYIARMDADDVSLPERLECQVAYLEAHPGVGLVAAGFIFMDQAGGDKLVSWPHTDQQRLREALIQENRFCHGVVMLRRACVESVGGYREVFRYAQDYDLWLRILERYEVACLDKLLYRYRVGPNNISVTRLAEQDAYHSLAKECYRRRQMGLAEDLSRAEKIAGIADRPVPFVARFRARRAMSEYYLKWGRSSLAGYKMPAARRELLRAARVFPLDGRPWFYLGLSLMGAGLLRRVKPVGSTILRRWRAVLSHGR
jgi:glycosyltransferase involved in cell wall biosynthesis